MTFWNSVVIFFENMIQVTFSTEFSLFRLLSLLLVHGSGMLFDSNLGVVTKNAVFYC